MRLDKFLKVSRVIKRRSVGKELALKCRVKVNGRIAKPSTELHEQDILELTLGDRILSIRIMDLRSFSSKSEANTMYQVVSESFVEKTEEIKEDEI